MGGKGNSRARPNPYGDLFAIWMQGRADMRATKHSDLRANGKCIAKGGRPITKMVELSHQNRKSHNNILYIKKIFIHSKVNKNG